MKIRLSLLMLFTATTGLLSPAIGCKNLVRALERKTILKRMWSLTSLKGVYTETGIAASPQQTELFWRAEPPAVLARIISPGAAKGNMLHYVAGTLSLHFPKSAFGIRYLNVPEISAAQQMHWLEAEYDWHLANYDITQIEDGAVAGYPTTGVRYAPNAAFSTSPFSYEWRAAVYAEFAFALEMTAYRDAREKYRLRFDRAEFMPQLTDTSFAFRFPAGTTIGEYDLAGRNLSIAEAKTGANFTLRVPDSSALFTQRRLIRAKGLIPAYTFYFENLPYQTFYTQIKDYGLRLIPEQGLKLAGKRDYRVQFAGSFRSIWFLEKGVYYAVVSSRPLSEVLDWLEKN